MFVLHKELIKKFRNILAHCQLRNNYLISFDVNLKRNNVTTNREILGKK